MFVLLVESALLYLGCKASPDCHTYTDCLTCSSHKTWSGDNCRWCPLDRECHAKGSLVNSCRQEQNIKNSSYCYDKTIGKYNPVSAYYNTLLSAVAYFDDPQRCMSEIYPQSGFELQEAIGRRCEDLPLFRYKECFAYTAVSHDLEIIALVFRGTDFRSGNKQLYDQIAAALVIQIKSFIIGGEVQDYFINAYNKLFPCTNQSIVELLQKYPNYDVVVTGHSLGGAIASLSAASLVFHSIVNANKLSLYTFGSPRVGDKEFALQHDKIMNNSWRVVHYRDIVSHLPTCNAVVGCRVTPNGPYHHGIEIFYNAVDMNIYSDFIQCKGDEDDDCSDGVITHNWCVPSVDLDSCIDYHKHYFQIPVGTYCDEKTGRFQRSVIEQSRMWGSFSNDKCTRIDLSEQRNTIRNTASQSSTQKEQHTANTATSKHTSIISHSFLVLITVFTV